MLHAILFDLDGTLANTDPLHYQTWQETLHPYGFEFDTAFYEQHFSGRRNAEIVADLLPHLSAAAGSQLALDKEARFRDRAAALLTPLPGLTELLDWMATQSLRQAIVTNASRENAEFMLRVLHLESRFSIVISAEELPQGKPDPLPYSTGLERVQVNPAEAIAFEDSISGVRSAVGAGILTVGVATTHAPATLYQSGATLVIADFTDPRLQDLLNQQCAVVSEPPADRSCNAAELVDRLSELLDLPIAPEYRPGVIANLERIAAIAQLVLEFPLPENIEVAPVFQP